MYYQLKVGGRTAMAIGKMKKHIEMMQVPELRPYLPKTYWFSREKARKLLKLYSTIFIKPNHGSQGKGIIRVQKKQGVFEVCYDDKRQLVPKHSLYKTINSYLKPSRKYLIQQGIHLAKHQNSIFDIRVYMQKPREDWLISGVVARVAAPNRFLTNYHQGGHGEMLDDVLIPLFTYDIEKWHDTFYTITQISQIIANTLQSHHPKIRELGIDLGIDIDNRIWIIEANSQPGHKLFTQLPDLSMLYTIRENKHLIKNKYS